MKEVKFERHGGSAFHGIFVSACGTKSAMASKRNKLEFATVRTAIHGTTKSGVAAVNHFVDVIKLSFSGIESVFYFFIIVRKDSL
jgi:hypothetical protein